MFRFNNLLELKPSTRKVIENVVKCPLQDDFIAYELHGLVRNTTFVTDHFFRLKEKFGNLGLSLFLLYTYIMYS